MNSFDPTLLTGPLLLGHIFNSFLYGVELLQFYRYHTSFPDDKPWTRRLVYSVVLLDTLQSGFAIHNAWKMLGSGWGNPHEINNPEWSWGAVPLFTGLVSLLVQSFYAYRISKLIQSRFTKWIVGLILLVSITQSFCGALSGVYYALGSVTGVKHVISSVTTTWLGGTALCDLIISTTIVTFLLIQIAGFTPKDSVVSRIIKMTVEIGAITTSAAVVDLVLFLAYPNNNLHLMFCIPLAKIYSNTLLAMLNARRGSFQQDTPAPGTLPTVRQFKSHSAHGSKHSKATLSQEFGSVIDISKQTLITASSPSVYSSFATSPHSAQSPRMIAKPQPTIHATPVVRGIPYHQTSASGSSRSDRPILSPSFMKSHQKSHSGQRIPFRNSILRMQRPSKAQANADFDKDFPQSHLDHSIEMDNSFRKWVSKRF